MKKLIIIILMVPVLAGAQTTQEKIKECLDTVLHTNIDSLIPQGDVDNRFKGSSFVYTVIAWAKGVDLEDVGDYHGINKCVLHACVKTNGDVFGIESSDIIYWYPQGGGFILPGDIVECDGYMGFVYDVYDNNEIITVWMDKESDTDERTLVIRTLNYGDGDCVNVYRYDE